MKKTAGAAAAMDRGLRAAVTALIDRRLEKTAGAAASADLRAIKAELVRLARRVDALAAKASHAPRRAGAGRPGRPPIHDACTVPGCKAEHYALGLCSKHYQQKRRSGALPARRRRSR